MLVMKKLSELKKFDTICVRVDDISHSEYTIERIVFTLENNISSTEIWIKNSIGTSRSMCFSGEYAKCARFLVEVPHTPLAESKILEEAAAVTFKCALNEAPKSIVEDVQVLVQEELLEDVEATEEAPIEADAVDVEPDPFAALLHRDFETRMAQLVPPVKPKAEKLEPIDEYEDHWLDEPLNQVVKDDTEDPIRSHLDEYFTKYAFFISEESHDDFNIIINIVKSLPEEYCNIWRDEDGFWRVSKAYTANCIAIFHRHYCGICKEELTPVLNFRKNTIMKVLGR